MILYGSSLSPFVRKTLAYAAEKGIALDLRPTGRGFGNPDPEFAAASPLRKMPALVDGDYALADSSAIIHYLEAKHPDPALIPADPRSRGRTIWWDEFADTALFSCGAKMFFNRIVSPLFVGRPGDEDVAAKAEREELPPLLDYLDRELEGRDYLVGDALTLADLAVASPFGNFAHLGIGLDGWPTLDAWVRRMHARPSFADLLTAETALLEKVRAR